MKLWCCCLVFLAFTSCRNEDKKDQAKELDKIFRRFDEEYLRLFPLEATARGDDRFNDVLNIDFTDGFRDSLRNFYSGLLKEVESIDTAVLNENDLTSYLIFKYEMKMNLEELEYPFHFMPFQQFSGLPLDMGQFGSGEGSQPFLTPSDYRNWNKRAERFSAWADSAIVYFRKGMKAKIVLPRSIVLKMISQLRDLGTPEESKNVFFGPVLKLKGKPDSAQLAAELKQVVKDNLQPAYSKLADFLENEYLPVARTSSGMNMLPGGEKMYNYYVRLWTTIEASPEKIYQTGLSEVSRIRKEMERVKDSLGFEGDLVAFFQALKTDPELMPFNTPEDVLNAFRSIQRKIKPNLEKMFGIRPKSPFVIRRTEAFREASAAAEYQVGTADGSRPGTFYVPIPDARKFNIISGMESLFLHEAIPGHHYQLSIQQENVDLPDFRRYAWYGAMGEGWALYCESLGKELGLYTDPYQYLGALGDEMHRAIRLVVDVAIHRKGMTEKEAIEYMMENEAIDIESATAEIERYIAWPGQALSYKVGALKILELRQHIASRSGSRFSLTAFHDEILKEGVMPLWILEKKMKKKH